MILSDRQALERLIDNDARNIRDIRGVRFELVGKLVIDLILHWVQARDLGDRELRLRAEENMRDLVSIMDSGP